MKYGTLNLGQIEAVVNKLGGMGGVELLLADKLIITSKNPGDFYFTVDYSQSLADMVAAGGYRKVYDTYGRVTAMPDFPISGKGVVEFEARYFFGGYPYPIRSKMEDAGWEPAKIEHLLSHGKTFPEQQEKFSIAASGSVVESDGTSKMPQLCVGSLRVGPVGELHLYGDSYAPRLCFLAVRKVVSVS